MCVSSAGDPFPDKSVSSRLFPPSSSLFVPHLARFRARSALSAASDALLSAAFASHCSLPL
eukprot:2230684-Prymnesium_polylepis.4